MLWADPVAQVVVDLQASVLQEAVQLLAVGQMGPGGSEVAPSPVKQARTVRTG